MLALLSILAGSPAMAVELPKPSIAAPIKIRADSANHWREKQHDIWILSGNCLFRQGSTSLQCQRAVVWAERGRYGELTNRLTVFVEGNVELRYEVEGDRARITDASWYGQFDSTVAAKFLTPPPGGEPNPKPLVYHNAMMRRNSFRKGAIRRTQFVVPNQEQAGNAKQDPNQNQVQHQIPAEAGKIPPPATRRLRVFPRSSVRIDAELFPGGGDDEWIAVIKSGVNLLVDGVDKLGSIDVSTDRLVIWTAGMEAPTVPGTTVQDENMPLEIYMEGNIVFRQGERIIYADRMYYDVRNEVGVILKAELLTPVENYLGTLRLRADVIQQISRGRFQATNAYITSSRLGVPGYRLASGQVYFEDLQETRVDFFGEPIVDPLTGETALDHRQLVTSRNNLLFLGEIPVFYWPILATDLDHSHFFLRRFAVKNDQIYGTRVLTAWDPYQLLGITNPPPGTDWTVSVDYLGERGLGHGTNFAWHRGDVFGLPGPNAGFVDYWGVNDRGFDNLGGDRRALLPEKGYRFRLLGRHRWHLADDWQLTSEIGWVSDRNFLEQYFEHEWDQFKDLNTGMQLKRIFGNSSVSVSADMHVNSFFNQVEQLPRFDVFTLGESLLGDWFTWYQHSQAGYLKMYTPTTPEDPADLSTFAPLPWETGVGGGRFVTRQEIDLPIQAGPFKFVPYAMGELIHWDEDLAGSDNDRAYGQGGVRASFPMWAADPTVENQLLNLHGLAHKVNFHIDASYSDATRDLTEFPLYDPLDDNSTEHFRRRFLFNTFGGVRLPSGAVAGADPRRFGIFDERFYALRSGLGDSVTSPSAEIADDLAVVRLGIDQRWQTKRGLPGQRKLQDWIIFNTGISWFPDEDRDNFGEDFTFLNYNFLWNLGERTTVVSRGIYDFFVGGQDLTSIGIHIQRPPRSSFYIGFRSVKGPINSQALLFSYDYRMSPKWISRFSTGYDFGENRNIGQNLSLLRIGESFLLSVGFNVDANKDVVGVNFNLEPRFLPRVRLGNISGVGIPPAGAFGLE